MFTSLHPETQPRQWEQPGTPNPCSMFGPWHSPAALPASVPTPGLNPSSASKGCCGNKHGWNGEVLGYHLQPAGPVHPNRAEHPEEALPAGMEPSPRSQSRWCPPERRLMLAQELDYRAFPLHGSAVRAARDGIADSRTHGTDPKWKCSHPPAAVISVLSNADLTSAHSGAGRCSGMSPDPHLLG